MTLTQLNAKILAESMGVYHCLELQYQRDERLGHLGVFAGMEPTEEQVQIVHDQLFPGEHPILCKCPDCTLKRRQKAAWDKEVKENR